MQNTKLIRLLIYLQPDEYKSFLLFVRSPYHNSNKQLAALAQCLHVHHPGFDLPKLTKEYIYKKMHPAGKLYHEGRMNVIMSQLVKLCKQFLAFEQLKKDDFQLNKFRLIAYKEKRMDGEFAKASKKQEEALSKWRDDGQYHLEKFLLNKDVFYHPGTIRYHVGMKSLNNSLEALDMFFVWEKLRLAVAAFNRMRIINEKPTIRILQKILKGFENEIQHRRVLGFYKKLIQFYTTGEMDSLYSLVNEFESVSTKFDFVERQSNFTYLINIFSQYHRNGILGLESKIFQLYRIGLKLGIFIENEKMNDIIFTNIVSIGSMSYEFEWTMKFIENHNKYISDELVENAVNLSNAYICYYKAFYENNLTEFSRVLDYLEKIDYSKPNYSYRARGLSLRTYYEFLLKEKIGMDFILDYCNAFEKYLKRDKSLEKTKKKAFLNFIKQTRKLIKWNMQKLLHEKNFDSEIQAIRKESNLFAKNWLIIKIGELRSVPQS